jgi:hypothetical protein
MPPPAEEIVNGMICSPTESLDTAWVSEYEVFKETLALAAHVP